MKRLIAAAGLALVAAVSTAACAGTHTSSPSVTVTAAPPAQTSVAPTVTPTPVAPPPRSSILDLALPDGFFLFHSDTQPNYRSETWESSGSAFQHTADAIRAQLPVGAELDGIPWCAESHKRLTGDRVVMFWVSADANRPAVEVEVQVSANPKKPVVDVYIGRWVSHADTCAVMERLEAEI